MVMSGSLPSVLVVSYLVVCTQARKQERARKQAADEHATALLAVEARLAAKQREVASLHDLNTSLFARFQDMRNQLSRNQDKLSHEKLRGGSSSASPWHTYHPQCHLADVRHS